MRLFHPNLGREITVPDSSKLVKVLEESGWKPAPAPAPAEKGREPEPVRYEPVQKPKAKPKGDSKGVDSDG